MKVFFRSSVNETKFNNVNVDATNYSTNHQPKLPYHASIIGVEYLLQKFSLVTDVFIYQNNIYYFHFSVKKKVG